MLTAAHASWQLVEVAAPRALERRWHMLARCGRAWAGFRARLKHAARRSSTADARQRSCQQIAMPLQSAMQPLVEVFVGLAAARDVAKKVSPSRAVPCSARRARSRLCDVHTSVRRCRNVYVSSMCSAVELCFGVCIAGVHARVLARACVHVPCRGCRTRLPVPGTARPLSSCRTTGRSPRARGHPPWRAVHIIRLLQL